MKFKLDENLGARLSSQLVAAGHDVATVHGQDLSSAPDETVIAVCQSEDRCLVTLDLDFSNPMRFEPAQYSGIVVLRPPARITPDDLDQLGQVLIEALKHRSAYGRLWIVQPGRIREYQPPLDHGHSESDQLQGDAS